MSEVSILLWTLWIMKKNNQTAAARNPKRVFLVDQFPIVRLWVAKWLRRTSDLALCGETGNARSALKAIRRLKPDIVVTEILRQQDFKFIQTLHRLYPRLPILVFSFRDDAWYAPRALEAGADGYMRKGGSVDGLVNAIRRALKGRVMLSPNARFKLLVKWLPGRRWSPRVKITGAGILKGDNVASVGFSIKSALGEGAS
jgi:DNA-binding NtrC family response regulator